MAKRLHSVIFRKSIVVYFVALIVVSLLLMGLVAIEYGTTAEDGYRHNRNQGIKYKAPDALYSPSNTTNKNGARVFILAVMRSGSSFLGEIFGQRDDFFYTFEPCRGLADFLKRNTISLNLLVPACLQHCERIFQCEFKRSDVYREWLKKYIHRGYEVNVRRVLPELMNSTCHITGPGNGSRNPIVCDNVTASELTNVCTSRRHIAIKSIRIHDLNQLTTLIRRGDPTVKVIHLARDPRGILSSRFMMLDGHKRDEFYSKTGLTYRNMEDYCTKWVTNREIGEYLPWMSGRYYLIRYEDLARFPPKFISEIYEFVGLTAEIPERVSRWIEENTKGVAEVQEDFRGTRRNSNETYERWRTSLPYTAASLVQNMPPCRDMMKMFGYIPFVKQKDLLDQSKSFVAPLPPLNASGPLALLQNA